MKNHMNFAEMMQWSAENGFNIVIGYDIEKISVDITDTTPLEAPDVSFDHYYFEEESFESVLSDVLSQMYLQRKTAVEF